MRHPFLFLLAALCAICSPGIALAQTGQGCPAPKTLNFQVAQKISRDTTGFTQGLEFYNGRLFESTGALNGSTRLNTIAPNGRVTRLKDFGQSFFGEGLTILGQNIYQLSWQEHKVSVYDLKGKLLRTMTNPREGWGLTHDATHLILSDGSDELVFASPKNLSVSRTIKVRAGTRTISQLNELEYVDGKIWANVFLTDDIIRINPATGCVEAHADLSHLRDYMNAAELAHLNSDINFVLNGIAYDRTKRLFYVTGKVWKSIFTGRFVEK